MKNLYTGLKIKWPVLLFFCSVLPVTLIGNLNGQVVTTDKVDYLPGDMVVTTGSNWIPGETVSLSLTEQTLNPACPEVESNIVRADANGSFRADLHRVLETDKGGFFHLKALGAQSSHISTITFNDAAASYAIDFSAYDPEKYARKVYYDFIGAFPSGRTSSPLGLPSDTEGHTLHSNTVESLEPSFLGLGQIVAFEFWVRVGDISVGRDTCSNDVIRFTAHWDTQTTSGDNFGFNPSLGVVASFVDISHTSAINIHDPDNNASASIVEWHMDGTFITATIEVSGLDTNDEIPVEVWLVLKDSVDRKASGNVQTALLSAVREGICAPGTTINTGNQTVPLLQVGSFFTTDVDVSITKTDSQDPVNICGSFYYTITVTNNGPAVANNVVVTDDLDPNVTYVSSSITDVIGTTAWTTAVSGQTLTFSTAYLNIGESVTITVNVNVANTAKHTGAGGAGSAISCPASYDLCNHVAVTTISDDINSTNNNYYQPTGVSCETVAPVISGCPTAEIDLGCNPTPPSCESVNKLNITATDACFGVITPVCSAGSIIESGCTRTQKFTLTFTDGCGNSSKCEVNYKWTVDAGKPVLSGKASILLGCNPADPSGSFETPTVTDDCGTPVPKSGYPVTGETIIDGCSRSMKRTWVYFDACLNESLPFEQTISWTSDTEKPVITTVSKSGDLGCNPASIVAPVFTGSDNCKGEINPVVTTDGATNEGCKYTQTWKANFTDDCGNSAQEVVITWTWSMDGEKPVITTDAKSGDLGCITESVKAPVFTGTDNCAGPFDPVVTTDGPQNEGCKYTQIWKANFTDECGNTAQEVVITWTWSVDNEKPVITTDAKSGDLGCITESVKAPVFTGTDNCAGTFSPVVTTVGPQNEGCKYTQTWKANYTDGCGNKADEVVITWTWSMDSEKPVITTDAKSGDLGCNPASLTAPVFTGTDNCVGAIMPVVTTEGPQNDGCKYIQTWKANYTDGCGNKADEVVITWTWSMDSEKPVITTDAKSGDLGCNPASLTAPVFTGTDNCVGAIMPVVTTEGPQNDGCKYTQTWKANYTDGCGNKADEVVITWTWSMDSEKPVITTDAKSGDLGCITESVKAPVFTGTDNCAGTFSPVVTTEGPQNNGCKYTQTWKANYTDGCGNKADEVVITWTWSMDSEKPVITTDSKSGDLGCITESVKAPVFTGTDNCAGTFSPVVTTEGPQNDGCKYTQTWKANYTDGCGNKADEVVITWTWSMDSQKPVITTTAKSGDLGCITENVTAPVFTGTDNCEGAVKPAITTEGPQNDGCKYTQTWKANYTDGCGNKADEVVITWTWSMDNQKPVITTTAKSGDLGCNPSSVNVPVFTGTDNCEGAITPVVTTTGHSNDGCNYTQTWKANYTDDCGNKADEVTITYTWKVDTQIPVITAQDKDKDLGCNPVQVTPPSFTGTDNCEGTITPVVTSEGPTHTGCSYTQTWTAIYTDDCGNKAVSKSVTYTWKVDVTKPVISCPSSVSVCEGESLPDLTLPTAKDECGTADVTWTRSDGAAGLNDPFTQQTTTITFTAIDQCGNTATCSMTVTIVPCSRISLRKTTNGSVDPTLTWTFVLYEGNYGGKVLTTQTTKNVTDGILFDDYGPLSVSKSYTVCETGIPSGFGTTWFKDDNSCDGKELSLIPYTDPGSGGVFNPNSTDNPPQDVGTRCYTFSGSDFPANSYGDPACYYLLEVDNKFPGGEPRTPGYWKNWTSRECSGGNQYLTATANSKDKDGDGVITGYDRVYSGWALLDDILKVKGITWTGGTAYPNYSYPIKDCKTGVMILNQVDTKNKKHANDAAYTLAMHLLAYQLNQGAGAYTCPGMTAIEQEAILLLAKYKFNSTGDYLLGNNNKTKTDYNRALKLASILDSYNNGATCQELENLISMIASPTVRSSDSGQGIPETVPDGISFRAYPNPFTDIIRFEIGMTYDSNVRLEIFTNNGTPLGLILNEDLLKGDVRTIEFNGSEYLHSVFMYRLTTKYQQLSGTVLKTR